MTRANALVISCRRTGAPGHVPPTGDSEVEGQSNTLSMAPRTSLLLTGTVLLLASSGCGTDDETAADGRKFCQAVRSGRSVVDIALAEPIEHPPGVYEALVAEWVSEQCPELAIESDDLRQALMGWGFDPRQLAGGS
jgi:hypothetical protein